MLPESYSQARSAISNAIVNVQEYDCCINDCVIFRQCSEGSFESLTHCPECDTERYHPQTKVARKTFKYIPIGPKDVCEQEGFGAHSKP